MILHICQKLRSLLCKSSQNEFSLYIGISWNEAPSLSEEMETGWSRQVTMLQQIALGFSYSNMGIPKKKKKQGAPI